MSALHHCLSPISFRRAEPALDTPAWSLVDFEHVSGAAACPAAVPQARTVRNESDPAQRHVPWSIYVVDECPGLARLAKAILDAEGFPVRAFSDQVQAWRAFIYAVPRPRLLVTGDLGGAAGIELIRRCRALEPDLKTLWVSHRDPTTLVKRDRALVDGFQPRPYCGPLLVQAVWRLCGPAA